MSVQMVPLRILTCVVCDAQKRVEGVLGGRRVDGWTCSRRHNGDSNVGGWWCGDCIAKDNERRSAERAYRKANPRPRGFAAMRPEMQKAIASKGGKKAHTKGKAHEWTKEEAQAAGRKGGLASRGGRGKLPKVA